MITFSGKGYGRASTVTMPFSTAETVYGIPRSSERPQILELVLNEPYEAYQNFRNKDLERSVNKGRDEFKILHPKRIEQKKELTSEELEELVRKKEAEASALALERETRRQEKAAQKAAQEQEKIQKFKDKLQTQAQPWIEQATQAVEAKMPHSYTEIPISSFLYSQNRNMELKPNRIQRGVTVVDDLEAVHSKIQARPIDDGYSLGKLQGALTHRSSLGLHRKESLDGIKTQLEKLNKENIKLNPEDQITEISQALEQLKTLYPSRS